MNSEIICPVPIKQRPSEEFLELSKSWLFSKSLNEGMEFYSFLVLSWLGIFPLMLTIASESWSIKNNTILVILITMLSSSILPFLILLRQWLGWKYIYNRLISKKIEYEESGWYDGYTWEKPYEWQERDLLIANYEIKPTLKKLEVNLIFISILIIFGIYICRFIVIY